MNGQDWQQVVFTKKHKPTKMNQQLGVIKENETNDIISIQKITKKQTLNMMQHRLALGYKTQVELAKATKGKITVARVAELENGKGQVPSGIEKSILFRLLKIKF